MIKGSIHEEQITIKNIHIPNIRSCAYIKKILKLMQKERDNTPIMVGDFNTPL